jgi:signal transduction histidine kinase
VAHVPRAGFGLLLLTLAGVAWLAVRDAAAGEAAVAAERRRLEAVGSAAFREELLAALDVAQARLDALEELPLLDEVGLVLVRDGVQVLPRVAGVALAQADGAAGTNEVAPRRVTSEGVADEAPRRAAAAAPRPASSPAASALAAAALDELLRGGAPELDAAQRALVLEASTRGVPPSWPGEAPEAPLLSTLERGGLPPLMQLAWQAPLVAAAVKRSPRPAWAVELAGTGRPRRPDRPGLDGLQGLVLRAWPWLGREAAGRWCLDVRRLGEAVGAPTRDFEAACTRGLAGRRVEVKAAPEPWLSSGVLGVLRPREAEVADAAAASDAAGSADASGAADAPRVSPSATPRGLRDAGGASAVATSPPEARRAVARSVVEVRGVELDLPARLASVVKTRRTAGVLAEDDELLLPPHDGPLSTLTLTLRSPRLDAVEADHASALGWKLGFVGLTALLGAGVLALATVAQRRREETLAAQREFIATVSHELRTPLASLRLLAETLERRLEGTAAARDYPRRLVQAADGLTFLVDNILSFNRIEAGRWVPAKEPFAFTALEGLLRDEAALAPDGELAVSTSGLDAMRPHTLDARLLEILVRNLARNAWKYGQRRPTQFSVAGHDEAGVAVLRFSDDGPGIPAAEHERVFEAFHRLGGDEGRAAGGAGLGLALARRIATLHGGTLAIASSSPAGTTFELRLPR